MNDMRRKVNSKIQSALFSTPQKWKRIRYCLSFFHLDEQVFAVVFLYTVKIQTQLFLCPIVGSFFCLEMETDYTHSTDTQVINCNGNFIIIILYLIF